MLITYSTDRKRWEAITTYQESNTANPLLKQVGFAFDGIRKQWHSAGYKQPKPMQQQAAITARLYDYCDDLAKAQLATYPAELNTNLNRVEEQATEIRQDLQAAIAASRATDSDINLPAPAGCAYLPYQKAGVAYAMTRKHVLIGDEMGLGKTIQGVGISNADPTIRKVLIICPATPKINWRREWMKWDVKGLSVGVMDAKSTELPDTDVVILNFDIAKKFQDLLRTRTYDLMIIDECHKVKNPDAQRTVAVFGRKAGKKKKNKETGVMEPQPAIPVIEAHRNAYLTGTPIPNRPIELFPMLERLDPEDLGRSFFAYAKRYCNATQTQYGWDFSGASNLDELQEKLRSKFMVRRLKVDVLKDLPPKRRQVILVEPDDRGRNLIAKEKAAWAAMTSGKVQMEEQSVDLASMSSVRKEVAVYKVPFVIDHVNDLLEAGIEKIVVMAHHKDVVDALMKEYGKAAVKIDGRVTKIEDRQAAVDRFQDDPECKIFIGSIQAAGVAITLTAAAHAVFAELDWVPGNMHQAEDRIHRIGQSKHCLIQYILLDDSLDANMINKIIEKLEVLDAALDKRCRIESEEAAVVPIARPAVGIPTPKPPKTDGSQEIQIKGKSGMETVCLTPGNIEAIHAGLKRLRSVCDGAQTEDGHGFSKLDREFGWSLADSPRLSPKQAAYGQRFIRKYQGQLPEDLVTAAGVVLKS
jgi:SWI/SNF-related matrix-associated actin-dependent regulator 1 of chromatin subfamily A